MKWSVILIAVLAVHCAGSNLVVDDSTISIPLEELATDNVSQETYLPTTIFGVPFAEITSQGPSENTVSSLEAIQSLSESNNLVSLVPSTENLSQDSAIKETTITNSVESFGLSVTSIPDLVTNITGLETQSPNVSTSLEEFSQTATEAALIEFVTETFQQGSESTSQTFVQTTENQDSSPLPSYIQVESSSIQQVPNGNVISSEVPESTGFAVQPESTTLENLVQESIVSLNTGSESLEASTIQTETSSKPSTNSNLSTVGLVSESLSPDLEQQGLSSSVLSNTGTTQTSTFIEESSQSSLGQTEAVTYVSPTINSASFGQASETLEIAVQTESSYSFSSAPTPLASVRPTHVTVVNRVPSVDATATILHQENIMNADSSYKHSFETSNGISVKAEGDLRTFNKSDEHNTTIVKNIVVSGGYSYIAPNGQNVSITYTADETGYHPKGDLIPTSPPIPPQIAKALEWIKKILAEKKEKEEKLKQQIDEDKEQSTKNLFSNSI